MRSFSQPKSTYSTALLLALFLSIQWVDALGLVVKSGFGAEAESKKDAGSSIRSDGADSKMSINKKSGAEKLSVVNGDVKEGPCLDFYASSAQDAYTKCQIFLNGQNCPFGTLYPLGQNYYDCCCN